MEVTADPHNISQLTATETSAGAIKPLPHQLFNLRHIGSWITSRAAPLVCIALVGLLSASCQSRSTPTPTVVVIVNTMNPRVYVTLAPRPTLTRTTTPTVIPTIPHLPTLRPSLTPTATPNPTYPPVSDVLPPLYQSLNSESAVLFSLADNIEGVANLQPPLSKDMISDIGRNAAEIRRLRNDVLQMNLNVVSMSNRLHVILPAHTAYAAYADSVLQLAELLLQPGQETPVPGLPTATDSGTLVVVTENATGAATGSATSAVTPKRASTEAQVVEQQATTDATASPAFDGAFPQVSTEQAVTQSSEDQAMEVAQQEELVRVNRAALVDTLRTYGIFTATAVLNPQDSRTIHILSSDAEQTITVGDGTYNIAYQAATDDLLKISVSLLSDNGLQPTITLINNSAAQLQGEQTVPLKAGTYHIEAAGYTWWVVAITTVSTAF